MITLLRHSPMLRHIRPFPRHGKLLALLLVVGVVITSPAHAQTVATWTEGWSGIFLTAFRYGITFVCVVGGLGAILWGVIHFITLMRGRNSQHTLVAIAASIAGGVILLSFSYFTGMLTRSQSSNGIEFNGSAQQIQMDQ